MNATQARQDRQRYQSDLKGVSRQLERWRRNKSSKAIPEALWSELVNLARHYGISRVCQPLSINATSLKRRLTDSKTQGTVSTTEFVELPLPTMSSSMESVLEMEDGQGAKLTVRLPQAQRAELLAVIQSFWRRGT